METKLLKAKEVSKLLNIGLSTIYSYAETGFIKSITLPSVRNSVATKRNKKAIRFTIEAVEEFIHNLATGEFK